MVAFAFVGVVVGAGFATGQEIFQFFTSNGIYSISGIIIYRFDYNASRRFRIKHWLCHSIS